VPKFVFKSCRVREDRVISEGDEAVFDIPSLLKKFAPERARRDLIQLRALRVGQYIGIVRGSQSGKPITFFLWNNDRTNRIAWVLKKDPTFPERLIEIYRVEHVDWGSRVVLEARGKPQPGVPEAMA